MKKLSLKKEALRILSSAQLQGVAAAGTGAPCCHTQPGYCVSDDCTIDCTETCACSDDCSSSSCCDTNATPNTCIC